MAKKIIIHQIGNIFQSNKKEAIALSSNSFFGEIKEGKVIYSILEVLYLLDKGRAELLNAKDKKISYKELFRKLKNHKDYIVFNDLRNKGYILKEGLKFGADFRAYKPGEKPGKQHAPFLLYIAESKDKLNLKDFCAKARIAHSTNKTLLLALIDSESDVNYYSINWKSIL